MNLATYRSGPSGVILMLGRAALLLDLGELVAVGLAGFVWRRGDAGGEIMGR